MNRKFLVLAVAVVIAFIVEGGILAVWLLGGETIRTDRRTPHPDEMETATEEPEIDRNMGTLIKGTATAAQLPGSWSQFRGPGRDGIAPASEKISVDWPEGGPPVLWKMEVGEGHAGVAVQDGIVYLHDYDREKKEDAIRALSLADGAELWRYTYYVKIKPYHGITRTVPAVKGKYLVAMGPMCQVTCLDSKTGERRWDFDLAKEFGTVVPEWYAGQCPIIEGDAAIIAPVGDLMAMAIELETGKIRWKTPNPEGWEMTHASLMPIDYGGERQLICIGTGGVAGISAADGSVRWTYTGWKNRIVAPSALPIGDDRVLLTAGYGAKCTMLQLKGAPGRIEVKELWQLKRSVFGSDQQTPLFYGGHIYSVIPPLSRGELICITLDGKEVWRSGSENMFGLGPYMIADGKILALTDQSCELVAIEPSPSGYKELARAKIFTGHDAWAPMALAGGRLILRDLKQLICLDVSGGKGD